MEFRTELIYQKSNQSIKVNDNILLIGSCFAEEIGNKLKADSFNTIINPYGITFNPITLAYQLNYTLDGRLNEDHIVQNIDKNWVSLDFHSKIFSKTKLEFCNVLEEKRIIFLQNLKEANFLFITLGTAHAYKLITSKKIIGNCQKMPSNLFEKQLLEINDCFEALNAVISKIFKLNKNIQIVFTLSPVRHIKDNLIQNQVSKSTLRLLINKICTNLNPTYFPSYEIMQDDLRDYRFYKSDMIHPNDQAIDYIYSKFENVFFDENLILKLKSERKRSLVLKHIKIQN